MIEDEENLTPEETENAQNKLKIELLNLILGVVKFLRWLCVVLFFLVLGVFARSFVTQSQLDRAAGHLEVVEDSSKRTYDASIIARDVSLESRDASLKVLSTLQEILAELQTEPTETPLDNQAIIDALQAISRIENYLCGGTCPN